MGQQLTRARRFLRALRRFFRFSQWEFWQQVIPLPWQPKSWKQKRLLLQDARILAICLSGLYPDKAQVFSDKTLLRLGEWLHNSPVDEEDATGEEGEGGLPALFPLEAWSVLEKSLTDLADPLAISDETLATLLSQLNGHDPLLVNQFLQKLIGKLPPDVLEQIFRKLFRRLSGRGSAVKEEKDPDQLSALDQETRIFLAKLARKTKAYLADRLQSGTLTERQIRLHDWIMALSKSAEKTPVKGLRVAGVEISPAFPSTPAADIPVPSQPEVGPAPDPAAAPQNSGPTPNNRPKGSPWYPKRPG